MTVPQAQPHALGSSVLVTGAAGFIGSHVVTELLEAGRKVVALDDLSGGFAENLDPRAHFAHGSILDLPFVERVFEEHRPRHVFHLAAYAAEGLSHFIKRFNYQNNLIGSVNLINAAINHQVDRFVFTSSIAVYGDADSKVTENANLVPKDPYGIAKAAVEQELRVSEEIFGLPFVIFRPHNVYGPRQNIGDPYRNVVGIFMNQILQGKPLSIFGDGSQTRAFTYISDVAGTIARSAFLPSAKNQTFNLGSDQKSSVQELAELVSGAMGVPCRPRYVAARKEVVHLDASHEKASSLLGYESKVPLSVGLEAMASWVKQSGARTSRKFDALEIEKNLPALWTESES